MTQPTGDDPLAALKPYVQIASGLMGISAAKAAEFAQGFLNSGGGSADEDRADEELMDEVLTPDSSRFWPADSVREGENPPSFDKQYLRDWLEQAQVEGRPWPKAAPAPALPADVAAATAERYASAARLLTGA